MGRTDRIYPGKIILFGEYTVIQGSDALAYPVHNFSSRWNHSSTHIHEYNLQPYIEYLKTLSSPALFDIIRIQDDLREGVDFESSIPVGAGLGSSGALVAGIF